MEETKQLAANDNQTGWTGVDKLPFNGEKDANGNGNPQDPGYGRFNNITADDYVDLGSCNVLKYVIYTSDPDKQKDVSTSARSLFNTSGGTDFRVSETENTSYLTVNDLSSSYNLKIYYVNLKAIKRAFGSVYLNSIKEVWNSEGKKIMLYETPGVK